MAALPAVGFANPFVGVETHMCNAEVVPVATYEFAAPAGEAFPGEFVTIEVTAQVCIMQTTPPVRGEAGDAGENVYVLTEQWTREVDGKLFRGDLYAPLPE